MPDLDKVIKDIKEEKVWLHIEFDGWAHIMLVPKNFDIERLKNSIREQINDQLK